MGLAIQTMRFRALALVLQTGHPLYLRPSARAIQIVDWREIIVTLHK
jgi:hypothetical protein